MSHDSMRNQLLSQHDGRDSLFGGLPVGLRDEENGVVDGGRTG